MLSFLFNLTGHYAIGYMTLSQVALASLIIVLWMFYQEKLILAKNIISQTVEAIIVTDLNGNTERVNSAFATVTGYQGTEVIGQNTRFEDINDAIDGLDANVISIETSRSHGELIRSFEDYHYHKGIGLGVYDIHSPRVPTSEELSQNIERALKVLDYRLFWVNPDCGLKTRGIEETIAALKVMVEAAKEKRDVLN